MPEIDAAIAQESWEWLLDNVPGLADGVAQEVRRGARPDEIRRHVMVQTQRAALALRCKQAAEHLVREDEGGK
jgi:hypothetical protein